VTAYTLAGLSTSALVGAGLSLIGRTSFHGGFDLSGASVALAVALIAIAREGGFVAFPLPQLGRQTAGIWAKSPGGTAAAILWGLDLGLVVTTWLNFSGVWLLATVAFLGAEPLLGAALFAAYWFGRALPVWIAPLFMETPTDTPELLANLDARRQLFRVIHVAGLVGTALILLVWVARTAM
jgi:cytochrome c biogenesis protein CcdA